MITLEYAIQKVELIIITVFEWMKLNRDETNSVSIYRYM